MQSTLLIVLLGVFALAYHFGCKRAVSVAGGAKQIRTLHSRPSYYGLYAALWTGLPALLLLGRETLLLATASPWLMVTASPAARPRAVA